MPTPLLETRQECLDAIKQILKTNRVVSFRGGIGSGSLESNYEPHQNVVLVKSLPHGMFTQGPQSLPPNSYLLITEAQLKQSIESNDHTTDGLPYEILSKPFSAYVLPCHLEETISLEVDEDADFIITPLLLAVHLQ